ncbi:MAG: amidinotransferase [Chloroflexi bacterium]|nr:amidinotransferase [Chloroflexota bacterium]
MFTHAVTRKPGANFGQGLTNSTLGTPDYTLMLAQHAAYVAALRAAGLELIELDALLAYPDAHFVEDTAVITPDVAVIAHPGAAARRGEEAAMAPILAQHRPIARIEAPGTLDGGDVLMVGTRFFIGISERTNESGAEQLGCILERYGASWTAVPVAAGLHLKSDVNEVGKNTLLVTKAFADRPELADYEQIVVDRDEGYAANVLLVNGRLIIPRGFPKTKQKLLAWGADIVELDVSEACKMDGGLTCMSLRF